MGSQQCLAGGGKHEGEDKSCESSGNASRLCWGPSRSSGRSQALLGTGPEPWHFISLHLTSSDLIRSITYDSVSSDFIRLHRISTTSTDSIRFSDRCHLINLQLHGGPFQLGACVKISQINTMSERRMCRARGPPKPYGQFKTNSSASCICKLFHPILAFLFTKNQKNNFDAHGL